MSHEPETIALDLPDGRVLEMIVSGPQDGVPLLWHHGSPGCAQQFRYRRNETHARGLRYLTYTRAGAAGSTRRPGRSVADIVEDVAAILDHLDAERCLVGGNSGGAPHRRTPPRPGRGGPLRVRNQAVCRRARLPRRHG
jgi:pimeloyl-ACP methyl ester carboxylesterase